MLLFLHMARFIVRILERMAESSSGGEFEVNGGLLHRLLSDFAVQVFLDEYRQIALNDLLGDYGVPASRPRTGFWPPVGDQKMSMLLQP